MLDGLVEVTRWVELPLGRDLAVVGALVPFILGTLDVDATGVATTGRGQREQQVAGVDLGSLDARVLGDLEPVQEVGHIELGLPCLLLALSGLLRVLSDDSLDSLELTLSERTVA